MGKRPLPQMHPNDLYYNIALAKSPTLGNKAAKALLHHYGSASAIFDGHQDKVPILRGKCAKVLDAPLPIDHDDIMLEMAFIEKHGITPIFFTDDAYPISLRQCTDSPILLYFKGNVPLNQGTFVSIVGTRKHTDYGAHIAFQFIKELSNYPITIVSGLAYGIDILAHKNALSFGLPTIAVLAHGLDKCYPEAHKDAAQAITRSGGLLTEYPSRTRPERYNFPMRNRIIAGLCDVTVVIETEIKGGAMITAKLAHGYGREVAAFPGRTIDIKSSGCNYLIQSQMAYPLHSASDLATLMNWPPLGSSSPSRPELFEDISPDDREVFDFLVPRKSTHIDELLKMSKMSYPRLSNSLLNLELTGYIKALPGNNYQLSNQ